MANVSPINPATSAAQSAGTFNRKQVQSDFQSLSNALQSGNLASAQQAFTQLQTDAPDLFSSSSGSTGSSSSSTDTAGSALNRLAGSLQSGDLSGAQAAFATLQQSVHGGHHGGHHHHGGGGSASSIDSSTSAAIGVVVNDSPGNFSAIA